MNNKTWDLYEWITSNTDEIQLNCNIDKGTYIYVPNFSKIQHETINYSFAIYTPEDSQKVSVTNKLYLYAFLLLAYYYYSLM